MSNILEIKNLSVHFGGIKAVDGISMDIPEGKIITLIGANGAGKSTILRSVSGIVKPQGGEILFGGESLIGKTPDAIVNRGITLVPEGRRVFPNLTVLENLKIGAYLRKDKLDNDIEYIYSLFPRLKERYWQLAGTLSGGEQQMLAEMCIRDSHNTKRKACRRGNTRSYRRPYIGIRYFCRKYA